MNCNFFQSQEEQKVSKQNQNSILQSSEPMDSPLQIKLINFLGLRSFVIDKFVFKRKKSKYQIKRKDNKNTLFTPYEYQPPFGYNYTTDILEYQNHSVPVVKLSPIKTKNNYTIIYSHGNASDLIDSLFFVEKMSKFIQAEFIVFDYSGYGVSRKNKVGQEIICGDLQIVLAQLNKPLNNVILWGFSLGTFPIIYNASQYNVKAVIIQSPIASVSCIFHKDLHKAINFKEDYLANLNYIDKISGSVFIAHSSGDQIIPFSHGKMLYDKFVNKNGQDRIVLVEVAKIKHNAMNSYLVSQKKNPLKQQLFSFLSSLSFEKDQKLNQNLIKIKAQIKYGFIQQYCFDENDYQIVQQNETQAGQIKRGFIGQVRDCFCMKK